MLKWLANLAISLALLVLLLFSVDIEHVTDRLRAVNVGALGLACVVTLVAVAIRACRWQVIAIAYGARLSLWRSFQLIEMGNFSGQVLPASIGGDVVRAWGCCRSGLSLRLSIQTIVLGRMLGLGTLLVITVLSVPRLLPLIADSAMLALLTASAMGGLLALIGVILLDKAVAWLPWGRLRKEVVLLSSDARGFIGDTNASVPAVIASFATHLLSVVTVMILAWGIGESVHLYELVLLLPPAMFLAMMPISLGGWGVREGAMVYALGYVGVLREEAFTISVLIGIVAVIASLPGCVFMMKERIWRERGNELIAQGGEGAPRREADRVNRS